jgi:nitroreductase
VQTSIDTFVAAATTAGHAPSIHNSQPWRWVAHADGLDLYREHNFRLRVTDPGDRLTTLSCGTALHHARVALAAEGYATEVARLPDTFAPSHLAHLTVTGDSPATEDAKGTRRAIDLRHADRRPLTGTRIDGDQLEAVTAAAAHEGASLYVLPDDGVTRLAAATADAQHSQGLEPQWRAELDYWAGGTRPGGAGVPDSAIPQRPAGTTVPGRDFGRPGSLPVSAADDEAATFAIVYGAQDEPVDWLRAGEGVSAAWLAAVRHGVSVLPMSATIEVSTARLALRQLLDGRGEPYLVLRLGRADTGEGGPPHPPRIAAAQRIERA